MEAGALAFRIGQGLTGVIIGGEGWGGEHQLARWDKNADRIMSLESKAEVVEIRLDAAVTTDSIRAIIREELDRALNPVQRDIDDFRERLRDQAK